MKSMDRSASGQREVELKLQLPPGSRAILEASTLFANTSAEPNHQVTTYFDTPDGILSRAGFTLRIRHCGDLHTQTVKSQADRRGVAMSRGEWERQVNGNTPELSQLLQTGDLAGMAREIKGRLVPRFVTDIHRTTRLLSLQGSTIVEAAFDEGSIATGTGTGAETVSELELELKSGQLGPMYRLAMQLQCRATIIIAGQRQL